MDRWSLKGKKALATGATKGIGAAIVNELLELGAEVCMVSRSLEDIDHLAIIAPVMRQCNRGERAFGLGSFDERGHFRRHVAVDLGGFAAGRGRLVVGQKCVRQRCAEAINAGRVQQELLHRFRLLR